MSTKVQILTQKAVLVDLGGQSAVLKLATRHTFYLLYWYKSTDTDAEGGAVVDLAGSERVYKTGNTGTLLRESKHINVSLHYLEMVIVALQERSQVPPHTTVYMCPRTTVYMCPRTTVYMCPDTTRYVIVALQERSAVPPHTTIYVSSYYCIYLCHHTTTVYMCPHTTRYVSVALQERSAVPPHTTILLCMCPRTTIYVSSYYCVYVS
jgi:hypothetical protein